MQRSKPLDGATVKAIPPLHNFPLKPGWNDNQSNRTWQSVVSDSEQEIAFRMLYV